LLDKLSRWGYDKYTRKPTAVSAPEASGFFMPWQQTCVIARVAGIREDPVASVGAMVQLGLFYARYKPTGGFV